METEFPPSRSVPGEPIGAVESVHLQAQLKWHAILLALEIGREAAIGIEFSAHGIGRPRILHLATECTDLPRVI
jgi:hypothetical protein